MTSMDTVDKVNALKMIFTESPNLYLSLAPWY